MFFKCGILTQVSRIQGKSKPQSKKLTNDLVILFSFFLGCSLSAPSNQVTNQPPTKQKQKIKKSRRARGADGTTAHRQARQPATETPRLVCDDFSSLLQGGVSSLSTLVRRRRHTGMFGPRCLSRLASAQPASSQSQVGSQVEAKSTKEEKEGGGEERGGKKPITPQFAY